jgi:hypothetical protein
MKTLFDLEMITREILLDQVRWQLFRQKVFITSEYHAYCTLYGVQQFETEMQDFTNGKMFFYLCWKCLEN